MRVHLGHNSKFGTCEGAGRAGARVASVRAPVPTLQLLATQLATAEVSLAAPGCLAHLTTVASSFHLCEKQRQCVYNIPAHKQDIPRCEVFVFLD